MKDKRLHNRVRRGRLTPWLILLVAVAALIPAGLRGEIHLEGSITQDQVWTAAQGPYRLTGLVRIDAGAAVTLLPGVVVRFDDGSRLEGQGALFADQSVFDGVADLHNREQIISLSDSQCHLRRCVLQNLELVLRTSKAEVSESVIANRNGSGVTVGKACHPTITRNDFHRNSYYAVYKEGTDALRVPHNYWGASDGPSGAGPGSGDAVNAAVDFMPFEGTDLGEHLILLDRRLEHSPVHPGGRLTLIYGIANLNSFAHTAILGASIYRDPAQHIHSPDHDVRVTIEPGYQQFSRSFAVPATLPEDAYTVLWGVMKADLTAYYVLEEEAARLQVGLKPDSAGGAPAEVAGAPYHEDRTAARPYERYSANRGN